MLKQFTRQDDMLYYLNELSNQDNFTCTYYSTGSCCKLADYVRVNGNNITIIKDDEILPEKLSLQEFKLTFKQAINDTDYVHQIIYHSSGCPHWLDYGGDVFDAVQGCGINGD